MASERILNEYDSTRVANAVDAFAEKFAGYTPSAPVNPTDAMKAKLPSQGVGDRLADAMEKIASDMVTGESPLYSYEESPVTQDRYEGDKIYYDEKYYTVTADIDEGEAIVTTGANANVEEDDIPEEVLTTVDNVPDGDGESGGSPSADSISYDNTDSGLEADNVQDAIDEVQGEVTELNSNKASKDVATHTSNGLMSTIDKQKTDVFAISLESIQEISFHVGASSVFDLPVDGWYYVIYIGKPSFAEASQIAIGYYGTAAGKVYIRTYANSERTSDWTEH